MEIKEIKEELLFDFSLKIPRVLVGGKIAVLDNIKKIILLSETNIILDFGAGFVSVNGHDLYIRSLETERATIVGDFQNVEFLHSSD